VAITPVSLRLIQAFPVARACAEFRVAIIQGYLRLIPVFLVVKHDREFPAAFIIPVCPRRTPAFPADKLSRVFRAA
jgi:hypothetical protein